MDNLSLKRQMKCLIILLNIWLERDLLHNLLSNVKVVVIVVVVVAVDIKIADEIMIEEEEEDIKEIMIEEKEEDIKEIIEIIEIMNLALTLVVVPVHNKDMVETTDKKAMIDLVVATETKVLDGNQIVMIIDFN